MNQLSANFLNSPNQSIHKFFVLLRYIFISIFEKISIFFFLIMGKKKSFSYVVFSVCISVCLNSMTTRERGSSYKVCSNAKKLIFPLPKIDQILKLANEKIHKIKKKKKLKFGTQFCIHAKNEWPNFSQLQPFNSSQMKI